MNITIKLSGENQRTLKWLLGQRYGSRKTFETLLLCAAWDVAHEQAKRLIDSGAQPQPDGAEQERK